MSGSGWLIWMTRPFGSWTLSERPYPSSMMSATSKPAFRLRQARTRHGVHGCYRRLSRHGDLVAGSLRKSSSVIPSSTIRHSKGGVGGREFPHPETGRSERSGWCTGHTCQGRVMVRLSARTLDVVGTVVRLGLAAVWLVSGSIKAAHPAQTYLAVQAYRALPAGTVSPV